MENDLKNNIINENDNRGSDVVYSTNKDFYKGISGELRMKAEGLFKKAKEKGISIEDIDIDVLKESSIEFPGIGEVYLPAYIVKVKGRDIYSGQVIIDGKYIDYFNRYQKYISDKIEEKNILKDEGGKVIKNKNKKVVKSNIDLELNDWEKFQIGKEILDDKEFGMEKTITGACDRVIRKLMGENDWLHPHEARLLDEEFNRVQNAISNEQENKKKDIQNPPKKATERQMNYFKTKIKNLGFDPENEEIMKEIIKQCGFGLININDMTTLNMSKVIDNISEIMPKVKESLEKQGYNFDVKEVTH